MIPNSILSIFQCRYGKIVFFLEILLPLSPNPEFLVIPGFSKKDRKRRNGNRSVLHQVR